MVLEGRREAEEVYVLGKGGEAVGYFHKLSAGGAADGVWEGIRELRQTGLAG